tara:strand:- start:3125 stop:3421 length:297 start_codon:yes stop_codon:yes gene_type:complete
MNIESNGLSFRIPRDTYESDTFFQERVSFLVYFYKTYSESYKKLQQLSHIWIHWKHHSNTYPQAVMDELVSIIQDTPFAIVPKQVSSPIQLFDGTSGC